MRELLAGVCGAARDVGLPAELCEDGFPRHEEGQVYVFIPHELYATEHDDDWPTAEQRRRSIALCVENPGTHWFEELCDLAPHFPRLLAINRASVVELERRGHAVEHLQLG